MNKYSVLLALLMCFGCSGSDVDDAPAVGAPNTPVELAQAFSDDASASKHSGAVVTMEFYAAPEAAETKIEPWDISSGISSGSCVVSGIGLRAFTSGNEYSYLEYGLAQGNTCTFLDGSNFPDEDLRIYAHAFTVDPLGGTTSHAFHPSGSSITIGERLGVVTGVPYFRVERESGDHWTLYLRKNLGDGEATLGYFDPIFALSRVNVAGAVVQMTSRSTNTTNSLGSGLLGNVCQGNRGQFLSPRYKRRPFNGSVSGWKRVVAPPTGDFVSSQNLNNNDGWRQTITTYTDGVDVVCYGGPGG